MSDAREQAEAIAQFIVDTAARRLSRCVLSADSPGLEPGDWYVIVSGGKQRKYWTLWECRTDVPNAKPGTRDGPGFVARFELKVQPISVHVRLGTGDLATVMELGTPAGVICRLWHETKVDTVALVRVPADKAYVVGRLLAATYQAQILRFQVKDAANGD